MNRGIITFVALAIGLSALFVRLGLWQLDRLAQRREHNAVLASRLALPVVSFEQLRDTAAYRRVVVRGAPDYANEIVLTGRSRQGSPGVHVLTPLRLTGNDTAVIVVRGWLYSPDAATADLSRWREARTAFTGYALPLPDSSTAAVARADERAIRRLTRHGVRELMPYPVAGHYVVAQDSAAEGSPARLSMPALDNGPHLSYAVQWFSFAAIALVGASFVVSRSRAPRAASHEPPAKSR